MFRSFILLIPVLLVGNIWAEGQVLPADSLGSNSFKVTNSTGQILIKGQWKSGRRNGNWVWYYGDGKLQQRFKYKNGKWIQGAWYSEGGHLIKFRNRKGKETEKPDCNCGH